MIYDIAKQIILAHSSHLTQVPSRLPSRFTGDPPFCGVPGTLLGLLGAGGVELTWPGRLALGTGGVISFRSGERTPGAQGSQTTPYRVRDFRHRLPLALTCMRIAVCVSA